MLQPLLRNECSPFLYVPYSTNSLYIPRFWTFCNPVKRSTSCFSYRPVLINLFRNSSQAIFEGGSHQIRKFSVVGHHNSHLCNGFSRSWRTSDRIWYPNPSRPVPSRAEFTTLNCYNCSSFKPSSGMYFDLSSHCSCSGCCSLSEAWVGFFS